MSKAQASPQRRAFTLRFHSDDTYRSLQLTAKVLGVSMNQLAEAAIERELAVIGADLEEKLTRTVEMLRTMRSKDFQKEIEAFARAEVEVADPLACRMLETDDKYGVGAAFARRLERG